MEAVSVNQFRTRLKEFVDKVTDTHDALKVTRRNGEDFIVMSADDWSRHQETLYILQNKHLMKQINTAKKQNVKVYKPTDEEVNEITNV